MLKSSVILLKYGINFLAFPIIYFEGNYSIIPLHKLAPTIISGSFWGLGKCLLFFNKRVKFYG